uniref:Uncharacterized protein n=1 Tax=Vitis vinifera TaxID=29760 RepID=F6H0G4_VITVI
MAVGAEAEQAKMVVGLNLGGNPVTKPWIKRPKITGKLAPAKRGRVKVVIFDSILHSFASMFASEDAPISCPNKANGY